MPTWTRGVAHLLLAIVLMAIPWNKIYHILLSRNYVYMFVDLEKIKNTTMNIDYSLYLPSYSVTHMSIPVVGDRIGVINPWKEID